MKALLYLTLALPFFSFNSAETQDIYGPANLPMIVTAIGQSDKYLYIGTNRGLYQKHKPSGRTLLLNEKNSRLPGNYITSIACTRDGQAYIGTPNGILMWDNFSFLQLTTENSELPENHITALVVDQNDDLWIGTHDSGIVKGTGNPIKTFQTMPIKTNDERIFSIAIGQNGCVWVSFQDGNYACLRNGIWEDFSFDHPTKDLKFIEGDNFIFNLSNHTSYLVAQKGCLLMAHPHSAQKQTCCYYSHTYDLVIQCFEKDVSVYNTLTPLKGPQLMSYPTFMEIFLSVSLTPTSQELK